MPNIDVPGATLYYETEGSGPVLLCITGARGSADLWKPLARQLSKHFTVVSYDRRGYSRSQLSGTEAQDYEQPVARDADDAFALLKHTSGDEPATVIGSSSGAIVALELLLRHPDALRTLISHEPPAFKLLPDFKELDAQQRDVYDTYKRSGFPPAMKKFADSIKSGPEATSLLLRAFDPKSGPYTFANSMYWFEREFLAHPYQDFKPEEFKPYCDKLMLANGAMSDPEALQYRTNHVLADALGLHVVVLPGAHVGYVSNAEEFAKELVECLQEKKAFYKQL